MNTQYHQIIDANINRVSEGLRVIEDYARFVSRQKTVTDALARLRRQINLSEPNQVSNLRVRNISRDMRAAEPPAKRPDTWNLLKANFKRAEEGLRVLEEYTGNPMYNKARYALYDLEKEVLLASLRKPIRPGVYLISDDPKILEQGLSWKVSAIQLRDKTSSKQLILKKAKRLQAKATQAKIPFIVNDYLDVALLADADGLHTGQDDLDIASLRQLLGPHKIIGRSSHSLAQGLKAQADGADYVSVGPIWATPTKADRAPIGFEYLSKAKKHLTVPYVVIGGVNLKTMKELAPFRPYTVAVVRAHADVPKILKTYGKIFS